MSCLRRRFGGHFIAAGLGVSTMAYGAYGARRTAGAGRRNAFWLSAIIPCAKLPQPPDGVTLKKVGARLKLDKGPTYDVNALYYAHDHGGDWVYEPRQPFTKKDVIVPGHFDAWRDELRLGSRITCRLGRIGDGITEVELQIIECPRWERLGHLVVSYKNQQGKFICVRHDGTLADETEKPEDKGKAA